MMGVTRTVWWPGAAVLAVVALSAGPSRGSDRPFIPAAPLSGALLVAVDRAALDAMPFNERGVIAGFPLHGEPPVDLLVERFRITRPGTRFVVGPAVPGGVDRPLAFDPDSVVLLHGSVAGRPGSHIFMAVSDHGSNGWIELGPGRGRQAISSRAPGGAALSPGFVTVFRAVSGGPAPTCHIDDLPPPPQWPGPVATSAAAPPASGAADPIRGLRQIEAAIETDLEFFQIFGDLDAAGAYVVSMYGAVSSIFMRDINVRVDLVFVRLWDTPQPFTAGLPSFLAYWNANMQWVERDVAQMFSGRGDKPGGVAYLNALCNTFSYSFCGNAQGFFTDPDKSSIYNHDILVAAHEFGHNFGTHHTDVYGIDKCNQASTPPRRGTIMSYCSQTVSGGMSVVDLRFCTVTQGKMLAYIPTAPCVVFDCNQNGIDDALDIASGFSPDLNANGIPDECEDCNGNGILDSFDIASGFSKDLNANGIPDECEPDCNGNGIPDDLDISTGLSKDLHLDGVPDECQPDCDRNGIGDYDQIMADMTLDIDRDVILDSCQDCDDDGIPDLAALDGSWNTWAASSVPGSPIREYHARTGVFMNASTGASLPGASDLIITPDRRILVSAADNRIAEFDRTGRFIRNFVPPSAGGLNNPRAMLLTGGGTLLVASAGTDSILGYDLATGAPLGAFIPSGSGGLVGPFGLARGPDGNLYVSAADHGVLRYDGITGAFLGVFVGPGSGSLNGPRGLLFKPDGNLLVASFNNNRILEYDGASGAFIGQWSKIGVDFGGPWCMRLAPNGRLHVSAQMVISSHVTKARIHEFNLESGNWLRGYVMAKDSLILNATGFDHMPDAGTDCNNNQVPDNCDIASGFSQDVNKNGIPDECESWVCYADCNNSGTLDIDDFLCFQLQFALADPYADCDGNQVLNIEDFICFQLAFALGCD